MTHRVADRDRKAHPFDFYVEDLGTNARLVAVSKAAKAKASTFLLEANAEGTVENFVAPRLPILTLAVSLDRAGFSIWRA
jgi:hypothetical protein